MSNWRGKLLEESDADPVYNWLINNVQYVFVAVLMGFIAWNRGRTWERYVTESGVVFNGNDPWYHFRQVQYTVQNWPATQPFDPFTYFSFGTSNSQFGTLFDQLIATAALVVGLGTPSEQTVAMVHLFAPVAFGTLIAIPAYVIARRLSDSFGGVLGVALIAFMGGGLVRRSMVGTADHHVAEALFQAIAVLGMMVALSVAERDPPVWELLVDGAWDALRQPVGWAVLAGIAAGLYLWVWPPGVLLLGIFAIFFVVHLSAEVVRGRSPEHAAFVGAVAMGTTFLMTLSAVKELSFTATEFSLIQPSVALATAIGAVVMAWMAREWEARDLPAYYYPGAVAGIIVVGAGVAAVVLPAFFGQIQNNLVRIFGFWVETGAQAGTVGEVQGLPVARVPDILYQWYGLAAFSGALGAVWLGYEYVTAERPRGEYLLVLVWATLMFVAMLTQARFGYYVTVPIAALNAALFGRVLTYVRGSGTPGEIETYQVITVVTVLLLILAPLAVAPAAAINEPNSNRPGGITGWQGSLDWMSDNTPAQGQYDAPDAEAMDSYGEYSRSDDYDYPEGAYGVLSWWDYGHWITTGAARAPNANPFQQGATQAANFLLAPNESQSQTVLTRMDEDDAETRYVMVDWKMAETRSLVGGKFFAPPNFYTDGNVSQRTYYQRVVDWEQFMQNGSPRQSTAFIRHEQPYYESMVVRLYQYHGSRVNAEPVVVDWERRTVQLQNGQTISQPATVRSGRTLKRFNNMSAARDYVAQDGTARVGGVGGLPSETVPALEHYRLVHASNRSAAQSGQYLRGVRSDIQGANVSGYFLEQGNVENRRQLNNRILDFVFPTDPAWTKTFERVPGATIEGEGPAETTVRATVTMRMPKRNTTFEYSQQAQTGPDGEFTMTVPYSTTAYDDYGPETGDTNVSVRATGPYQLTAADIETDNGTRFFQQYRATVDVPEGAVNGASDATLSTSLSEGARLPIGPVANDTDSGGSTAGNETSNGTADADPDLDAGDRLVASQP
jgi:oligosaccharyl transferase (archaeosortase A-associated)